jgi:DNA-binding transcriptional MerR regulator
MAHALRIGQLAQATGVPPKTIRYYEEVGVLPAPRRSAGGYRQYTQQGVHRVAFIRRARTLGLPLRDLKALTAVLDDGPRATVHPRLLTLVRAQLSAVQQQATEPGSSPAAARTGAGPAAEPTICGSHRGLPVPRDRGWRGS